MIDRRTALLLACSALALVAGAALAGLAPFARPGEPALVACWLRGELPGWDPYAGDGRPLLGAALCGPWYPPNALALLLPASIASLLRDALALALLGLGLQAWRGSGAGIGLALAVQLTGAALAATLRASALDSLVWVPWMLAALGHVPRPGLRLAGCTTLAILAGEPRVYLVVLALVGLLALFSARARLGWLALGVLGGAVAWLPLAESARRGELARTPVERRAPGLPACELVGDPAARMFVRREAPDRLDVEVESARGGRLVMRERWHPGWEAAVNGEDAEVREVQGAWRAVDVPAGRAVVRTKFEALSLRLGALLTFAALILAVLLARPRRVA